MFTINNIHRLLLVMEKQFIFCEVCIEYLNITETSQRLQTVIYAINISHLDSRFCVTRLCTFLL